MASHTQRHTHPRSSEWWSTRKQGFYNKAEYLLGRWKRICTCKLLFGLRWLFCLPNPCVKIPHNIYFSQQVFYLGGNDLLKLRPSLEIQPKI